MRKTGEVASFGASAQCFSASTYIMYRVFVHVTSGNLYGVL